MKPSATGIDALRERYGIPGVVRFEAGPNGLTRVVVVTPQAETQLYLHGAHLAHYQPRGDRPLLFLSEKSRLAADAPIRGGVPIVFPWFGPKAGDPSAPTHGFARVAEWSVESATQAADGSVELVFCLDSAMATHPRWTHAYSLRYRVAIGSLLELVLEVHNPSEKPFAFEEALHTYLSVGDARQLSVTGLADTTYIDKTDGARRKVQGPEPIRITAETDRVYLGTRATCVVDDPAWARRLAVEKSGSEATVVWNPWIAKAKAMPDFGDEEWPGMLCLETGNVADHAVTLQPGQHHELRVVIRSEPMKE